jgi:hypothetical protein
LVALEAGFGRIVLHLQIERLSDRAEEFFEQYGVMAPPDVKSLQLRPGGLTNQETPEARVVRQHQAAVDGSPNVGFHHVGELEGSDDAGECVIGVTGRPTTVADHPHQPILPSLGHEIPSKTGCGSPPPRVPFRV